MQQTPTMSPTAVNCNGAYADCAPTVSPSEDVVEQTREAIILSFIIAGLAVLATAFLVAGMYHSTWYPILAKRYGWELPEEDFMEELSSTHSQTALVSREDRRRAVLDDHQDIENAFIEVELQEDAVKDSTKKKSHHVKFKDVDPEPEPVPEPDPTPDPPPVDLAPVASAPETEILYNMQNDQQSRDLLFGPGTFSTASAPPVEATAPVPTPPVEVPVEVPVLVEVPVQEVAPIDPPSPAPETPTISTEAVLEPPLVAVLEGDSLTVPNPFGDRAGPVMAEGETEPTITI